MNQDIAVFLVPGLIALGGAVVASGRLYLSNIRFLSNARQAAASLVVGFAGTALVLSSSKAFAETRSWNVTEETADGIKNAQGSWSVTIEGEKITGAADLTLDAGTPLSYKLDGSVKGGVYTINLVDRSDSKKGCVWSGHKPGGGGTQTSGLSGFAQCDGAKLIIRASFIGG